MINTLHSPPFRSQTVLFQKINYMVTLWWMIWQCQVSLFYATRKMCPHLHKKAGVDTFPSQGLERGKGSRKERQESPVSLLHRCWESQAGKNWKHFTTSRRGVGRFWNHTKLAEVGAPRASPHRPGLRVALCLWHPWAEGPDPSTWRDGGITTIFWASWMIQKSKERANIATDFLPVLGRSAQAGLGESGETKECDTIWLSDSVLQFAILNFQMVQQVHIKLQARFQPLLALTPHSPCSVLWDQRQLSSPYKLVSCH